MYSRFFLFKFPRLISLVFLISLILVNFTSHFDLFLVKVLLTSFVETQTRHVYVPFCLSKERPYLEIALSQKLVFSKCAGKSAHFERPFPERVFFWLQRFRLDIKAYGCSGANLTCLGSYFQT